MRPHILGCEGEWQGFSSNKEKRMKETIKIIIKKSEINNTKEKKILKI